MALIGDTKQAMSEGKSGPVETGLTKPAATDLRLQPCVVCYLFWTIFLCLNPPLALLINITYYLKHLIAVLIKNHFVLYAHTWYKDRCLNEKGMHA